jgi:hypothetical protein
VEQLGAGRGAEGVQALPEPALEFVWTHGWRLAARATPIAVGFTHPPILDFAMRHLDRLEGVVTRSADSPVTPL